MFTRRDVPRPRANRLAGPTILITAIVLLAAGCDKIQIPEVGQQAAPPPAAAASVPVQAAPPVAPVEPIRAAPPDPKAVVTAFIKKSKTDILLDRDLEEVTSAEGAEGFDEVQELNLGGAGITDLGVARLSKFPKLTKLELASSGVTNVGLEVIKDLPELRTLGLSRTKADDRIMATIASHPGIKELNISGTAVTDFGLNELEKLDDLEVLDISSTSITGSGFERFRGHKNLRAVIAQRSSLQNEALKFLINCPIEVLEIDLSGVTDLGMVHVGKMKKLKKLSMGFSNITDFGIHKLGVMKDLEWVNARNCAGISRLLFQKLMPSKNLKFVCVIGTAISATDCATLKKLKPGCQIDF